ncbi:helix-turn-helix domain-containing protein [Candidatus Pacearchaeota archaeon]|nr:helix-turn-helix domain-containing protein [Candidatus Pacearchaeota archaeon]
MEFEEPLRKAGLTGNESIVFIQLLKYGEQSANEVSKRIGMDRTLTYTVLNHLIEKGLVNYVKKSDKKFFKATDPSNLLNSIKEKEIFVKELVSKLKTMEKGKAIEQEVNVYEGKEAIRNMYNLFRKHKEMLSFGATGRAYDYLYESPALTKELIKQGMKGRIITSRKYKDHPMTKIKTIDTRYVDYESEVTTTIFGNYVMNHIAKEKPLVILIKNKEMAETYRKHFELLWGMAES